jgi:hypothetical protein
MVDEFTARYGDLLTGSYDCVDRIVLNAYFPLGHNPGGFRVWWRRWHDDTDEGLDNARLMRLAGRFARRVRGWAAANRVPVIDCRAEDRKHRIAEGYLREHAVGVGVFLILVSRAPATVWEVSRSGAGVIGKPGEGQAVRQPLLVPRHGPGLRASDDQDEWAPAVRRADHPQRARVRRLPGSDGRHTLCEGGQLFHQGGR